MGREKNTKQKRGKEERIHSTRLVIIKHHLFCNNINKAEITFSNQHIPIQRDRLHNLKERKYISVLPYILGYISLSS